LIGGWQESLPDAKPGHTEKGTRCRVPFWSVRSSVALVHTGVDVRDNGALMDVVDPVMVSDVGVGLAREAEDSGHKAGGCDGG
jgi:hypothetical protein